MLITTRLADTYQVHHVAAPGATRRPVTSFPDNVRFGVEYQPRTGESFLLLKDTGGDENFQILSVDLASGKSSLVTDGKARNTSNVGAHTLSFIPLAKGIGISTSVYHVPAASLRGRAVLSNTTPTFPYRAAGRPEIMYVIERLIDLAAQRHGFDRIALRRKNLVKSSAMPYRNPVGLVYDSGDYAAALDRLVELSDWKGFESRRADARRRGRHRGIGFAHYIELNTGDPRERAEITVRPEGRIDVVLGTLSAGQGHETSFPQLIAEWFGVEHGNVKLITGDTDLMPVGGGTASGRSMRLGAVVMAKASDQIVEKGRRIAASLLEAAEPDIEFARRRFTVKGTDRSVDLFEAAAASVRAGEPLAGACTEVMPVPSYPYGCAVSEVEVDPDTGVVDVVRHTTVDDVGRAVNPLILHGQAHGGMAAGIGQALLERCVYEAGSGQLQSATLMDYALPRADMLPMFTTEISEVPSTTHPLGLRGGGEGGTTPALAATQFALFTALTALPRTLASATTGFLVEGTVSATPGGMVEQLAQAFIAMGLPADGLGWTRFFLLCAACAVPGMLLLIWVAPHNAERSDG